MKYNSYLIIELNISKYYIYYVFNFIIEILTVLLNLLFIFIKLFIYILKY